MRKPAALASLAALTALALLATAMPAPAQQVPALRVSEIFADPAIGSREFIEVWNPGTTAVALVGWKLKDQPTTSGSVNTFTFPTWSLPGNGRIVVWGGGASDALGPAWSASTAWNNAGDAVHLLAPDGTLVDWAGYGTANPAPEPFAARAVAPQAPKGSSVELSGDGWAVHEPTPGTVPGAQMGQMTLQVTNVAPTAAFGALARSVRPGAAATLPLVLADGNGPDDIASWRVTSAGVLMASGLGISNASVTADAPGAPGPWPLQLTVTDRAGLNATANATLTVRWSDLLVQLPPEGFVRLPAVAPGGNTLTLEPIPLRNDGDVALVPRLDVSPFRGPVTMEVEGRLWVGTQDASGTTWTQYTGPLTPLPQLAAQGEVHLLFEFRGLPAVPAGIYGTSFTVVA